jgi:hypothetical protein
MHPSNRFVTTLFLTAALASSGSIVTAATPQASVQVRVYDAYHHDYHNWDEREDHAYRRNDVFSRLKRGQVNGRVVLGIREETSAKAAIAS